MEKNSLKTQLLPHQKKAWQFIKNKDVFALYMDMGTGKTRIIIENIFKKKLKKVLYFCPVFLKYTVRKELIKHITGPNYWQESGETEIEDKFHIHIVGIHSINSDRVYLMVNNLIDGWGEDSIIIVDESSFIKSFNAQRSQRIIQLSKRFKHRAVLTGTPITQYYQDLFTQFKFLNPSIIPYRSYFGFCNRYLLFDDKYKDTVIGSKNIDELVGYVSPYIFQKKKEECFYLPKKIYKDYSFDLSWSARVEYDTIKNEALREIDRLDYVPKSFIFQLFTKLQKVTSSDYTNRVGLLKDIIASIGDEKICVLCKYHAEIQVIQKEYPKAFIYTGKQTIKERNQILEKLEQSSSGLILMTYGSGSYGLNLNFMSQCIYYSSVFKYGQFIQSSDRFHRIGQANNVIYHSIAADNSIDQRILVNLQTKKSLIADFEESLKNKKKLKQEIERL